MVGFATTPVATVFPAVSGGRWRRSATRGSSGGYRARLRADVLQPVADLALAVLRVTNGVRQVLAEAGAAS